MKKECEKCGNDQTVICEECAKNEINWSDADRKIRFEMEQKRKSSYQKLKEENEALKNEIDRLNYDISILLDDEAPMEQKFAVKIVHSKGIATTADGGVQFTIPGARYNMLQHIDLSKTQIENEEEFDAHCQFDSKAEWEYVRDKEALWLAGRIYKCTAATFEVHLGSGKVLSKMRLIKIADERDNVN